MEYKICNACKIEKHHTQFGINKSHSGGVHNTCKECLNARHRRQYKNKLEEEGKTLHVRHKSPDGMKWCSSCEQDLDIKCFRKDASRYNGLSNYCLKCIPIKMKLYKSKPSSRLKSRVLNLQTSFGITLEQFNELAFRQGNKCAVCRSTEPKGRGQWHVDHCHETGRIRGLLCYPCNTNLGLYEKFKRFNIEAYLESVISIPDFPRTIPKFVRRDKFIEEVFA